MKILGVALVAITLAWPALSWADGMPVNFMKVEDGLFRGGQPSDQALAVLARQYGVRTDIDLQGGDLNTTNFLYKIFVEAQEPGEQKSAIDHEAKTGSGYGITLVPEPLDSLDPITASESTEIDQALQVMHDPAERPVYIHCQHGVDRTGLLIALYKVKYEHVDPQAAYNEWLKIGHGKTLNQQFTGNLDTYYWQKVKELQVRTASLTGDSK